MLPAAWAAFRVRSKPGPAVVERGRVEERIEQPMSLALRAVGVDAREDLGQHRVAEAVDGVRELGRDRAVDRGDAAEERVDQRLDLARELLEHQVLVLHLGARTAPPGRGARRSPSPSRESIACHAVTSAGVRTARARGSSRSMSCTSRLCSAWKSCVHGGQADVLVAAAVAGDEVQVEQLVVVGAGRLRRLQAGAGDRIRVGAARRRHGAVRDVVEERVAGPERVRRDGDAESAVRRRVALEEHVAAAAPAAGSRSRPA